jgi:hypothetical protein
MRSLLVPATLVCVLVVGGVGRADDVKTIIEKAVQAHGGADKLGKHKAAITKSKGTLDLLGGIDFTQEIMVQGPGKFKESMQLSIMGQNINTVSVFDGQSAWIKAAGMDVPVTDELMKEFKEAAYQMSIGDLSGIQNKNLELSLLGEVQVEGKPAVGIKVASKGHRDISLFFDKASHMLARVDSMALDAQSGQEVAQEKIMKEYQDLNGIKVPKKVLVNRDGKKFMDVEVVEVKFVDKIDDNEFAKP